MPLYSNGLIWNSRRTSNVERSTSLTNVIRCAVTWYKGVRELTYSKRHRVMAEAGNSYMMQIKSVLQTDPGEYTVVATNDAGQAHITVFVNVLPKPAEYVSVLFAFVKLAFSITEISCWMGMIVHVQNRYDESFRSWNDFQRSKVIDRRKSSVSRSRSRFRKQTAVYRLSSIRGRVLNVVILMIWITSSVPAGTWSFF